MPRPELSLVIPIYNEEEVLPSLDGRLYGLLERLGMPAEVVFVDDGSRDRSLDLLRGMAQREPRYRVASFSRNFGHQRAITCGMDLARGKAVVVIDADLQDPPEVILQMVAKWREGFDVVYGRRRSREGETWFKVTTAKIFYRLFAAMIPIEVPLDTGDFRLMSRRVVTTLRGLRESHRFVRGLVAWVGFRQTAVEYDRAARLAGTTKYPLRKMLGFALDGIASFSVLPLRAATYLGVFVGGASVLYALAAVATFLIGKTVPGWTTTVVLVSFLFSVQLLVTGVLGEYVGRIYEQLKQRPLYVVAERINFSRKGKARSAASALPYGDSTAPYAQAPVHVPPPPADATTPQSRPPISPSPSPSHSFASEATIAAVESLPTSVAEPSRDPRRMPSVRPPQVTSSPRATVPPPPVTPSARPSVPPPPVRPSAPVPHVRPSAGPARLPFPSVPPGGISRRPPPPLPITSPVAPEAVENPAKAPKSRK